MYLSEISQTSYFFLFCTVYKTEGHVVEKSVLLWKDQREISCGENLKK